MKVVFATNNQNKIVEIKKILDKNIQLLSLDDINCFTELPEDFDTLEKNALQKAQYVYQKYKLNCFADDTGLEVAYLDGAPGVYSARYSGENKSAMSNVKKLLSELKSITKRDAQFRTVIALILNGKEFVFEGIVKGEITHKIKGEKGFGYDPIFKPYGYEKTFAEMTLEQKNKISHRGIATRKLVHFLQESI